MINQTSFLPEKVHYILTFYIWVNTSLISLVIVMLMKDNLQLFVKKHLI